MIAGHTKFNVDRQFSQIAISYNRSDVFDSDDLVAVVSKSCDGCRRRNCKTLEKET